LNQEDDFDSLSWFTGVTDYLMQERKRSLQSGKEDENFQQASKLTAKRLQGRLQEFRLLRFNLSAARLFFQKPEIAVPEHEKKAK